MRERYRRLTGIHQDVRRVEEANQVALTRDLDPGFASTVFAWAEGKPLQDVLAEAQLAAGDFVRNCKQLLDLLRQLEEVAPVPVADAVRAAQAAVRRSVVAYTGVEGQSG